MTLPQDQEGGLKLPANKVEMLSKKKKKERKKGYRMGARAAIPRGTKHHEK